MRRPSLVRLIAETDTGAWLGRALAQRFQATLHDAERVPRAGPALVVGNHGLLGIDAVALTGLLVAQTGRYPRFLAERNLYRVPGLGAALDAVGAIRGAPEDAVRLLEDGELVCVYPGGVDDSFKLSRDAYTLQWGARAGFARVALRARAPLVPIAATGIDDLFDVPAREGTLGRLLLGSARYDLPLPTRLFPRRVPLDYYVLSPIEAGDADAADPEAVERLRRAAWEALDGVLSRHRAQRARDSRP